MGRLALALALGMVAGSPAAAAPASARIDVEPTTATVGDPLATVVTIEVPPGSRFEPQAVGPSLGDLAVLDGAWSRGPEEAGGAARWIWRGRVAAYRTGTLELPALRFTVLDGDHETSVATDPVEITIRSVLPDGGKERAATPLADLKRPATIPPNYRPLMLALSGLGALLVASVLAWWLHRRWAARLVAVPQPADPFRRLPPDVWVYQELKALLERRLGEAGEIERFFDELARILKTYLAGRYRVDLLERTTSEVPGALRQAGAPEAALGEIVALLDRADGVKFARHSADAAACRAAVEAAYRVVDATRPVTRPEPESGAA